MNQQKPISYDPDWQVRYKDQIRTAEQAVSHIRPGERVFIGSACGQPLELVRALVARANELADTEIVHLLTMGEAPYAEKELSEQFRVNSFFIAENVRDMIQEGLGDYTPIFLSDIPRLFRTGQYPLDVALIQVSPPDARGRCSLGISVDITKAAAENASMVIAQVNPQMPRTLGDTFLSAEEIDYLVPVDVPLMEVRPVELTEVTTRIGEYVASLVEDGATIELGIGRIPQAVLEFMKDKKDLGVHTEMFSDRIVELVERGVINGSRKTTDRGKVVASFVVGSRKVYDFIDNNPSFCLRPTEYVNDPYVISQQYKMVAINTALQVDLTGQVCSDSLGTQFYSGIGGQVDFNRGAARAEDGKAIIALPSTAKNGTVSRIVSVLSPGAGVVTTRGDVHYVVTEYGVAYLHGKTVQQRALALISIAHPDFRAQLFREAIDCKYIRPGMRDVEGRIVVGPEELRTSMLLADGTQINFRPIHPTDEPNVRDLFYDLSEQTVYYRFMRSMKKLPQKQVQDFVYIDHRNEVAIVATLPEAHGEEIIAVGRYYLDPKTNRAEVAFLVRDKWQRKGIGSFMLKYLAEIARRNGIRGFTAEVLRENRAMIAVLNKSGLKVQSKLSEGVYSIVIDF